MAHDGIEFGFTPRPQDDDVVVQDMDAVVKKYTRIYKDRWEDEMGWRLKRVIEAAYHDGFLAGQMSMRKKGD